MGEDDTTVFKLKKVFSNPAKNQISSIPMYLRQEGDALVYLYQGKRICCPWLSQRVIHHYIEDGYEGEKMQQRDEHDV